MDNISFKELELHKGCNITDECIKHTAQAGSLFPKRAEALKALEIATDHVKYCQGRVELDTHSLGLIPNPIEGEKSFKITVSAMKAYVDTHPTVIKARADRAQAEHDYDNIKGLVTAYNNKRSLLELMMADKKQEWHSEPKDRAENNDVTGSNTVRM